MGNRVATGTRNPQKLPRYIGFDPKIKGGEKKKHSYHSGFERYGHKGGLLEK